MSRPGSFQVRIHGRGGQGVVTAAELLSVAAFFDGHHAQAFPTFGSERAGAPVTAFCRISDREIRTRSPVVSPDALIIADPTLLHEADVFGGLEAGGWVLINTARHPRDLDLDRCGAAIDPEHVATVGATELAVRHLGVPLPNAVLLGGFAALSGVVTIDAVLAAIGERFTGELAEANGAAASEAFAIVGEEREELCRAAPD